MLTWHCKTFQKLNTDQLYAIVKARQDVFIIEQQCIYPDLDQLDQHCLHLFAEIDDDLEGAIAAYLRIIPPALLHPQASFGRVLTTPDMRGQGLGRQLLTKAIEKVAEFHSQQAIKISSQIYLQDFYQSFGFENISGVYDDDGIDHIDMLLTPS